MVSKGYFYLKIVFVFKRPDTHPTSLPSALSRCSLIGRLLLNRRYDVGILVVKEQEMIHGSIFHKDVHIYPYEVDKITKSQRGKRVMFSDTY